MGATKMKKYIAVVLCVLMVMCLASCGGPKEVTDMSYSATIGDATLNGLFTGTVEKKQPNGQGTFTYSDDSITVSYTGKWENGVPVGDGSLEYDGFRVEYCDTVYEGKYEGDAFAGHPNGKGNFVASNDDIVFTYAGEWKDGVIAGSGELEFSKLPINFDDHVLTGEFCGGVVDGLPCGDGEFTTKTEEAYLTYNGNWKDGVFSGAGTIDTNIYTVRFTDGVVRTGKYVGDVCNGLAEGEGTFTAVNDEGTSYTYVGTWKNGLYSGYGVQRWESDTYTEMGSFVDGEFFPKPVEFFSSKGTRPESTYTISNNALEFLKKYPDVFLENEVINEEIEYEENFQYKAFEKNPQKYGTKLITIPSLRVVQIFEYDYWGQEHSFIIAQDGSYNVYFINIYGYWENVFEGSYIKLTALPLDYFTYPNTSGQKIWAIACAGVRID